MLNQTTQDFRKLFLLEFTKEIIKNTKTEAIYELQERLKEQERINKEKIKNIEKRKENQELKEILRRPTEEIKAPLIIPNFPQRKIPMILRIPQPRLPPHLQYLKPYATGIELDLGKLNPLLKDNAVNEIECHGDDLYIVVRGQTGKKQTDILLNEEEINQIIDTIATTSKMPKETGLFHAVIGRIIFSAIISENGSKFIIKKIPAIRNEYYY